LESLKPQQIIPIGGGGFYRDSENLELEKYVIWQSDGDAFHTLPPAVRKIGLVFVSVVVVIIILIGRNLMIH